jgi:choline dehydrogenase
MLGFLPMASAGAAQGWQPPHRSTRAKESNEGGAMSEAPETFDYIVVGSGSAGAAVAGRLSESGRHSVLLLEAGGPDRSFLFRVPMGYAYTLADPRYDWMYRGEPEPGLNGRSLLQHRGKVLGGTSSVNGMIYTRGVPFDYDRWRQLGCIGWDWESVLPFFRKAENNSRGQNAFHGAGGPLSVSDDRPQWDLVASFLEAAKQAGLPTNPDLNGERQEGIGYHQYTIGNHMRASAARAYLAPARKRPNLKISTHSLATRILFEGKRAVGIEYMRGDKMDKALARGEIVVSGGTINSPQLLQISGIGPGPLLRDMGVPVLVESPLVGSNLQDHFQTVVDFRCKEPVTLNDVARSRLRMFLAGAQYILARRGPLSGNGLYAGGYVRTDPRMENPDVAINFFVWSMDPDAPSGSALATRPFSAFSFGIVLQRPDARGEVRVRSSDPREPPRIRYNFPGSDQDLQSLVEGTRISRRIAAQSALARYKDLEIAPGLGLTGDEELREDLRRRVTSAYHVSGTCQMGQPGRAVVDHRLRVQGVEGLRVADASIMPTIVAANTNAPTIMIGEKAAAMILEDR